MSPISKELLEHSQLVKLRELANDLEYEGKLSPLQADFLRNQLKDELAASLENLKALLGKEQ